MDRRTVNVRASQPPRIASPWTPTELDSMNAILALRGSWLFDVALDEVSLQHGLGAVLSHYPHLAGRVHDGRVELSNDGAPFTVQDRRELGLHDVTANSVLAHRFAPSLSPFWMARGRDAPLKVMVTRLRDGTLLNVTASHACMDGRGFYAFVQNWARCCTGRSFPEPSLDTSCTPAPREGARLSVRSAAEERGWGPIRLRTIVRMLILNALGLLGGRVKTAHYPDAALRALRRRAASASGCRDLRTFEALSAHLVRMCRVLADVPPQQPCTLVTILDARDRVASIPARYAANAPFGVATAGLLEGASLGELARQIHESLQPYLRSPATRLHEDLALARAVIRHRLWMSPYDIAPMYALPPTLTYVNNFATLPVYDVDFGQPGAPAVPVHVFPHDLPDPVLIWPAPPSQGGVEVYLSGAYARAMRKLAPGDPWFTRMRSIEAES